MTQNRMKLSEQTQSYLEKDLTIGRANSELASIISCTRKLIKTMKTENLNLLFNHPRNCTIVKRGSPPPLLFFNFWKEGVGDW